MLTRNQSPTRWRTDICLGHVFRGVETSQRYTSNSKHPFIDNLAVTHLRNDCTEGASTIQGWKFRDMINKQYQSDTAKLANHQRR